MKEFELEGEIAARGALDRMMHGITRGDLNTGRPIPGETYPRTVKEYR